MFLRILKCCTFFRLVIEESSKNCLCCVLIIKLKMHRIGIRIELLNYIIYYFKLMRRKEYSISIKQIEMCVEYKASL